VRVAIVALQDMVYIGRMFFGDADTGDVVWDCDVRPSDGELRQPKQCCVDAY
jgi:bifunctional DNase/RNase